MLTKDRQTYLIKLGGSLITDKRKTQTFKQLAVKQIFKQLAVFYANNDVNLILGNGAGSTTHALAAEYQTGHGFKDSRSRLGASIVKDSALAFHSRLHSLASQAGLPVFSCSPSSFLLSKQGRPVEINLSSLLALIKKNLIPFYYGDVIVDLFQGTTIYSTEKINEIVAAALVKKGFGKIIVIYLGDTAGVLNQSGKTIPRINRRNYAKVKSAIGASRGFDVTGGMRQKVESALRLAQMGAKVIIGSGKRFDFQKLSANQATLIN